MSSAPSPPKPINAMPRPPWWPACARPGAAPATAITTPSPSCASSSRLPFHLVDTEDDEELIGDLDVETFPTLLIGVGEQLRFIGPVTPQLATAQRLLESAVQSPKAGTADPRRKPCWCACKAVAERGLIEGLRGPLFGPCAGSWPAGDNHAFKKPCRARPMTVQLKKSAPAGAIAITVVDRAAFQAIAPKLPAATRNWLAAVGFTGAADTHALLPGKTASWPRCLPGVAHGAHPYALAALPQALPEGVYTLSEAGIQVAPEQAALSWELGAYQFDLYKPRRRAPAQLVLPPCAEAQRGMAIATVMAATRDLVNTPAEHMARKNWPRPLPWWPSSMAPSSSKWWAMSC